MLYKVKIETDIMVVADNNASAVEIAKKNAPSEVGLYGKGTAHVVNHALEIPDDWIGVIPYSKEGVSETKKCFEIVASGSVAKELPKEDIDEIIRIKSNAKISPVVHSMEVNPETRPDPKPKELDWHETKSGRPMPSLRFVR